METITKEYNIYDFKELKPEVQEEVIQKFAEQELERDWWEHSGILEFIQEDLFERYGIECSDIYFDLYSDRDCSLGSPRISDVKKFLIAAGAEKWMIAQHLDTNERIWDIDFLDIGITDANNRGYNEVCVEHNGFIDVETDEENDGDLEEDMGIDLTEFLQGILKEKLKQIQEEQEYISSRENIIELIEMNDYKFLENGEQF